MFLSLSPGSGIHLIARIRVFFFLGVGIIAPVDESPFLAMPILYRRPGGTVNNHEKPRRSAFKEHVETRNPAAPVKRQ